MRTLTAISIAALAMLAVACGSTSPTTPTTTTTHALAGTVRSETGGTIAAAIVRVLDGPSAGREASTDASGRYTFTGLAQAGFSIRASAPGFVAAAQGVTLTADTTLDFKLDREAVAVLSFESEVVFTLRPDLGYDLSAIAINTGTGCATSISGTTTITASNGFTLEYAWIMPTGFVVRPGERFTYQIGSVSRDNTIRLGDSGAYVTRATFTSSACQ